MPPHWQLQGVGIGGPDDVLRTPDDLSWLERFIASACLWTEFEYGRLHNVILVRDFDTDALGWWQVKLLYSASGRLESVWAEIVLNEAWHSDARFCAPGVGVSLADTLAHEYGHHWCLMHLCEHAGLTEGDVPQDRLLKYLFLDPLPSSYYSLRGLDPTIYSGDAENAEWDKTDKEVLAEDYRVLLTASCDPHGALPESSSPAGLKQYIRDLGL